jgi:hypothetical protein
VSISQLHQVLAPTAPEQPSRILELDHGCRLEIVHSTGKMNEAASRLLASSKRQLPGEVVKGRFSTRTPRETER